MLAGVEICIKHMISDCRLVEMEAKASEAEARAAKLTAAAAKSR